MGSSALRLPAARRHALALLLALPLLAACGREAPETLVVERLAEAQVLLVDAASTVGDPASELEVLRTVTLAPDGAGGLLLAPRDVYVRGDTYRTAEDGSRVLAGRLAGLDRSAQAATQPHLTPFWASARVRATDAGDGGDGGEAAAQLELGLLLPDGSLHAPSRAPAEALAQDDDESEDEDAGEPETEPEPTIDDAVPFLLRRVPDAVLALVAAQAGGTWAPGAERRIPVAVGRGRVLPALAGTLVLRRKEGRSWTLDLDVDWRADGPVADRLAWRIVHRVTGFVSVRRDGRLSGGSLASRTRVLDGEEVVGTARHRLQLGETEPTVRGDEAGDLARLLALRAEDETAFLKAVLEQSAASAHALVQRVRPAADLEHVSVFLSDQVEPRSWPSGRHASGASLEEAVSHRARWAPAVKRLLGPRAPEDAPPAPDASDAPDEPDEPDQPDDQTEPDPSSPDGEDWWREGGAAWTHLGVLTAGRGVVSQLDTLAHEYAHFACERFGYPDLARIGFSWDAEQPVWIDLDGLLALAVLEEAQAEATATCATHASFTAAEQRAVIRWYGRMDPRPTAEPDYRKRLYALAYGPSPAVLAAYCELRRRPRGGDREGVGDLALPDPVVPLPTRPGVPLPPLGPRPDARGRGRGRRDARRRLHAPLPPRPARGRDARGQPGARPRPRRRRPPARRARRPALGDALGGRGGRGALLRARPGRPGHGEPHPGMPGDRAGGPGAEGARLAAPPAGGRGEGRVLPPGRAVGTGGGGTGPGHSEVGWRGPRRAVPLGLPPRGAAMSRPRSRAFALLPAFLLAVLLVPAGVLHAKPEPALDARDVEVPAPPARQVLVATGTWGLGGGTGARLVRTIEVGFPADDAPRILPLAVSARGQGPAVECAQDAQGMRSSSLSAHRYTGSEGPTQAAAQAPLLHLWSASTLAAETIVVGPPTPGGGARPPAGGAEGQAWTETEDPVFHALFAPADLAMLPVLATVPGKWVRDQQRTRERTVARPAGLPAWSHRTTVHYLGVTKERVLFEFEVVTTGDARPGEHAWTLERKAVGSLLVTQAGSLFHGHVEVTGTVKDADGKQLHAVVSTVDLEPVDGEAPPAGAAGRFATALALRASDPTAFRSGLLVETAATARKEVAAIRDPDGLADVTVKLWDDSVDIGAVVREARQLADSPSRWTSSKRTARRSWRSASSTRPRSRFCAGSSRAAPTGCRGPRRSPCRRESSCS